MSEGQGQLYRISFRLSLRISPEHQQRLRGGALQRPVRRNRQDAHRLRGRQDAAKDTDYTYALARDNQAVTEIREAGAYTVTLNGIGNYTNTCETTVTVSPISIMGSTVTFAEAGNTTAVYSASEKAIKVTLNGKELAANQDYTLTVTRNAAPAALRDKYYGEGTDGYSGMNDVLVDGYTLSNGLFPADADDVTVTCFAQLMAPGTGTDKPAQVWLNFGADNWELAGSYGTNVITGAVNVKPLELSLTLTLPDGTVLTGDQLVLPADADMTNAGTRTLEIASSLYAYTGATLTATVTIAPATPTIVWPSAGDITYGNALRDSILTSTDANGAFAWKFPAHTPDTGERLCTVVYTPADTVNYNYRGVTLENKIPVQVNKAAAVIDVSGVKTAYSEAGVPMDYELLDMTGRQPGQTETVRMLLTEDTSGEREPHVLSIPASQLAALSERGVRLLAFTHLNATVLVPTETLLSGNAAKLAALALQQDLRLNDPTLDLAAEPDANLTVEQLNALRYEIRIAPVEGSDAGETSVWLCWSDGGLELTPYLSGLMTMTGLALTDEAANTENWQLVTLDEDGTEAALAYQQLVIPDDLPETAESIGWYCVTIYADGIEEVHVSTDMTPESCHHTLLCTAQAAPGCILLRQQATDGE